MGMYNFGKLISVPDSFSSIQGYELGFSSVQGNIKLDGAIFEVTPDFVNKLVMSN